VTLTTDGQTDRQTDRIAISISRVSRLTRDKNVNEETKNKLMSTIRPVQSHDNDDDDDNLYSLSKW